MLACEVGDAAGNHACTSTYHRNGFIHTGQIVAVLDFADEFELFSINDGTTRIQRYCAARITCATPTRNHSQTEFDTRANQPRHFFFGIRREYHKRQFHTPVRCIGDVRDTRQSVELDIVFAGEFVQAFASLFAQIVFSAEGLGKLRQGSAGNHHQF